MENKVFAIVLTAHQQSVQLLLLPCDSPGLEKHNGNRAECSAVQSPPETLLFYRLLYSFISLRGGRSVDAPPLTLGGELLLFYFPLLFTSTSWEEAPPARAQTNPNKAATHLHLYCCG